MGASKNNRTAPAKALSINRKPAVRRIFNSPTDLLVSLVTQLYSTHEQITGTLDYSDVLLFQWHYPWRVRLILRQILPELLDAGGVDAPLRLARVTKHRVELC